MEMKVGVTETVRIRTVVDIDEEQWLGMFGEEFDPEDYTEHYLEEYILETGQLGHGDALEVSVFRDLHDIEVIGEAA